MKRINFTHVKAVLAIAVMSVFVVSCDIEIEESDSIFTEETVGEFGGVASVGASVQDLYNSIYGQLGDQANFFASKPRSPA